MTEVEVRGGKNNALRFKYDSEKDYTKMYNKDLFLVGAGDMYIFDENENLILRLDKLIKCTIDVNSTERPNTIVAEDCRFNFKLFKFINDSKQTDYESLLGIKESETVGFKKDAGNGKKCKIIIIADVRRNNNEQVCLKYKFSNCTIRNSYFRVMASDGVSTTNIIIDVKEDENGNLFEMIF